MLLLQQIVNGVMQGSIYALVAIGYSLVFGLLNLLNLAHGELFMLSGFIGLFLMSHFEFPLWLALPLTMVAAGAIGVGVEALCFRPIKKEHHLAPIVSTIAFGSVLVNSMVNLVGSEPQVFPAHVEIPDIALGALLISGSQLLSFVIAVALMVLLSYIVEKTKLGRAIRAMAENEKAAQILGVNVRKTVMITFFISAALAGIAGILVGLRFGKLSPFIGATIGLKALAVMVIGGLGNIYGAMLAGLILGVLEAATVVIPGLSPYVDAVIWGFLVFILLFKPTGLLGTRVQTERV
ncbi:iron chelate uptake ABC transporter family permease subunit [Heliobacterium gestii]|uniref:Iron chelate uptake ABC transporter family permease subunit n=1 Tax=Heliomicrobium gestii TaxID=2699 RepID=A0A845LEX0_HELGE|nr:branched-chain amino acid ABC transporter permease [Heliomicrobium gestii]MBM7867718.1 branched-chain amino acid transport system permease protein [Heliomicrobium gestii]MZP44111.1 iron chelate uptake ABC transporter family permease subunit [Heliomicrobium gestii]